MAGDQESLAEALLTAGRLTADEITLFKSAGTAIEDLAAAQLAYLKDRG